MSKIIDEFHFDLVCGCCGEDVKTEHIVQKIDEKDNGEFIGYWAECTVCGLTADVPEEVFSK